MYVVKGVYRHIFYVSMSYYYSRKIRDDDDDDHDDNDSDDCWMDGGCEHGSRM